MELSQRGSKVLKIALSVLALIGLTLVLPHAYRDIAFSSSDFVKETFQDTTSSPPPPNVGTLPPFEEDENLESLSFSHFSLSDEDTKNDVGAAVRRKLHYSSYLYSGYQEFVKSFGLRNAAKAATLDEKCSRFFDQLSKRNPDWKMSHYPDFDDTIPEVDRIMRDVEGRLRQSWKAAHDNSDAKYVYNDEEKAKGQKMFEEIVRDSLTKLHGMDETTTIMRIFGKCFFNDDKRRNLKVYQEYTKKIFPFFSGTLPKFYRGNSDEAIESGFPRFDKNNKYTDSLISFDGNSQNFVEYLRTSINGRGIVISATDRFKNDLIGLIRVLRASNNRLPIQIVHLGDLSADTRVEILEHSTMPMDLLLKFKNGEESNQKTLVLYAKSIDSTFPAQEIWFVDIKGCVADEFRNDFSTYFEKILAYTFNSFSEILYMDADTVPLVTTDFLFASREYQRSGTYFFKDRAMKRILRYIDGATFLGLSPMNQRSIDTIFDIPLLTPKTTGNLYFQGWYHLQEAGVVLMDRRRHFLGTLMTLPLTIWNSVINNMVYGDKELYWLGLAIAGDESYEFNRNSAAAAGMVYANLVHDLEPKYNTPSICSTHPAHVNDEGILLWVNSGLHYCKKNGWEADKEKSIYASFSEDEMKKIYAEPSVFQGAVVPPDPPAIWSEGLPYDTDEWNRVQALIPELQKDRTKDHLLAPGKKLTALQYGWSSTGGCDNYEYCAYSKIVSFDKNKLFDYGKYYLFSQQQTKLYNFYGKLWMNR